MFLQFYTHGFSSQFRAHLKYHLSKRIHFAAILGVNIGMGNVTPPTAPLLYLAGRIAKAEVKDMLGPDLALIAFAWLPTLIVTTYFDKFATFLPTLFGVM